MIGINQHIYSFYKILFNSLCDFEKEKYGHLIPESFNYFAKNEKGSIYIENSPKSLFLRVFKKLFCNNLEKSNSEYSNRNSLFLSLFLLITVMNSESCLISSEYLVQLKSIITNNSSSVYTRSKNNNENFNPIYISIFCEITLRCATQWMLKSKKETPYMRFSQKFDSPNFELYPKLPSHWEEIISEKFLFYHLLSDQNDYSGNILCHLCYEDESTSIKVLKMFRKYLKQKYYPYPSIEYINKNTYKLFEIVDSYTNIRLETLFELEKPQKENETLFDYYINIKCQLPNVVLEGLFLLAKAIQQYKNLYEYLKKYRNKVKWVNEFYLESIIDSNNLNQKYAYILNVHPDLFEVIETHFINRLEI